MKKFEFAITDNTVYTGKDAEGFYSLALLSAPTVKNVTVVPNVKSTIKLAKFNLGNIIQDEACSFSATGEGTLSQKTFTTCPLKVNLEYCRSTFEQNYMNEFMRPGMSEQVMPESFQSYIVNLVGKQVSADLEKAFWQGNTTGATYPQNICDGLELKLAANADNDVIKITAATAITVSNILTEVGKVYSAITSQVLSKGEVVIFMGTAMISLFKQAIAAGSPIAYYTNTVDLNFLGVKIVEAPGMSNNKIVAAEPSNLLWLTDLLSDAEDVLLIPQRNISGVPSVRFVANFKFGAGYIYGAEIVYYA